MKRIIVILLISLSAFLSCSTNVEVFTDNGAITGYDLRECSCCGGFFIDIRNNTYRFYTVPANSNLDLENPDFPIPVNLDWKMDDNACLGDEILVLRIESR